MKMITLAAALALLPASAFADHHGHPPHAAHTPAMAENHAAMEKMHDDMMKDVTGDADRDFATMMIPHHQGAIDMARIELKHGKNPELRALAEKIIKAQEEEIAQMKAWLKTP